MCAMSSLVEVRQHDVTISGAARLDGNPAAVYLAGLAPSSRDTMRRALDIIARIVGGDAADYLAVPWERLRFQHTAAIRSELATRYSHKIGRASCRERV